MIEKIKEKLQEKYMPEDLIHKLVQAKTDDEMLMLAHQIRARIESVEHLNYELLKIIKEEG